MSLKKMQDLRNNLAEQIRKQANLHNSETGWASSDDHKKYDELNKAYDDNMKAMSAARELSQNHDAIQNRLAGLEQFKELNRVPDPFTQHGTMSPGERFGNAIKCWFTYNMGDEPSDELLECFNAHNESMPRNLRSSLRKELCIPTMDTADVKRLQSVCRSVHHTKQMEAMNDLSVGTPSAGGDTVWDHILLSTLEQNMLAYGQMRTTSDFIQTSSGEPLDWPTADNVGNKARIVAEATDISTGADPTFARVRWLAYKFVAGPIKVSYELLEDSVVNMPAVLGQMLGEQHGRGTNEKYTVGAGTTEPIGIVTASALGVTSPSGSISSDNGDSIIKLAYSVDPAYRQGASYMMHDTVIGEVRLIKDAENRFLWRDGLENGQPDRLNGYPVVWNQDMESTIAAANVVMLFGQLNRYKIRRVNGMRVYRLTELYRETDQDGFLSFIREDGNLLNAGTNPIKHMVVGA